MDKSSTEYENQGDWSDYDESKEITVHLPDTDNNESNDSKCCAFHAQSFIIKSCRKGLKKINLKENLCSII